MSESDEAEAPGRPLCVAHGLRYDSARYGGCVICRRAEAPVVEQTSAANSVWTPTTLLMLGAVLLLALALFRDVGADLEAVTGFLRGLSREDGVASSTPSQDQRAALAGSTPQLGLPPAQPESSAAKSVVPNQDAPEQACARAARGLDVSGEDGSKAVGALQRAAALGDVAKLVQEIDLGTQVDARDNSGRTPLAWAIATAHDEAARVLIDAQANPNLAAQNDVTPLMLAAAAGRAELSAALLQHGARPGAVDPHARTALMLAARNNRAEAISALIQHGAVIGARCERGMTALQHAAEGSACVEALSRLIELGAEVDAPDLRGASALMIAAYEGHADAVGFLLDHGAHLELRDHQQLGVLDYVVMPRDTLGPALEQGLGAVLQLLIDHNVSPRLGQNPATTPILFRAQLDAWARAQGRPPLPAYDVLERSAAPAAKDDSHAVLPLFRRSADDSRKFPAWLYPEASILTYRGWVEHVPNIIQQVCLQPLALRTGQQITLSGDAAGNEAWGVDDALLIERWNGSQRIDATFVGRAALLSLAQKPLERLGPQALNYTRGAIDFSKWLSEGAGADRVLISVVDYGGWASVSDVFLHVIGPHAAGVVKGVSVETMQPK